jgi:hypothetical protein
VPVSFFFEDAPGQEPGRAMGLAEDSSTAYVTGFLSSPEGIQLSRAFVGISNPKVRRKVLELVKALAGQEED